MLKGELQDPEVPLKFTSTEYCALSPGATVKVPGLSVTVFGFESLNVFCARTPDWLPTALRKKPTFKSCTSVVKLLSEMFPFASAVTVYGPCVSISGNSTSVIATDSPGLKPLPIMLTLVPGG